MVVCKDKRTDRRGGASCGFCNCSNHLQPVKVTAAGRGSHAALEASAAAAARRHHQAVTTTEPSPRSSSRTTTTTTKKKTMPVERVDSTSPPAVLRAHEEVATRVDTPSRA